MVNSPFAIADLTPEEQSSVQRAVLEDAQMMAALQQPDPSGQNLRKMAFRLLQAIKPEKLYEEGDLQEVLSILQSIRENERQDQQVNENNYSSRSFEILPNDIWILILSRLEAREIVRLSQVSKSHLERSREVCEEVHIQFRDQGLILAGFETLFGETGLFRHVKQLDLKGSCLKTHLQQVLPKLPQTLRKLSIRDVSFWAKDGEALSHLTCLQDLDLTGSHFENNQALWLKDLTQLKSLDLSETVLRYESIENLSSLTQLEFLNLSKYCDRLPKLSGLRHLNIANSTYIFVSEISFLTCLESLDLSHAVIHNELEGLDWITSFEHLESLSLAFAQCVDRIHFQNLVKLSRLRELNLECTYISPEQIQALSPATHFLHLNLGSNDLTPESAEELSKMLSLETLELGNNHLGSQGAQWIMKLPHLRKLDLSSNVILNEGILGLKRLSRLEILDLSNNFLTSNGLQDISGLSRLWYLNLAKNRLKDEGVSHIIKIPHLRYLDLSYNYVGQRGAQILIENAKNLKHLRTLRLVGNTIPPATLEELQKAFPFTQIIAVE